MKKLNLNKLAVEVAKKEGKKVNLSIAQIKEVIRLTLLELNKEVRGGNASGVLDAIERSFKSKGK